MIVSLLLAFPLYGQTRPTKTADSCHKTAQAFYDWYVPMVVPDIHGTPVEILKQAKDYLSPTLYAKLLRDYDASAHAEEVVGLDWDPFMASQDPEPHFRAQTPRMTGGRCRVPIDGIDAQGKRRRAATAVLDWTGAKWVFADLLEDNNSLLKVLDDLERDRQKWTREAAKSKKKD